MIKLTGEEIAKEMGFPYPPKEGIEEHENYVVVDINDLRPLAKAQLNKVREWGNEPCKEHHKESNIINLWLKHECGQCWQALLEATR